MKSNIRVDGTASSFEFLVAQHFRSLRGAIVRPLSYPKTSLTPDPSFFFFFFQWK
jgi:hypothetical protein